MRLLKPLLAAAAIAAAAVPALASAEPYWTGGQPAYGADRDYGHGFRDGGYGWRGERAEAMRIRFLRKREFERQRAFEHARWEWRQHHDYGYQGDYRGW
jgi:hypothetical protein